MRLVTSVQLVVGLAAGGSVALVLSGSALAADGSATTTTQSVGMQIISDQVNEQTILSSSSSLAAPIVGQAKETEGQADASSDSSSTVATSDQVVPQSSAIGPELDKQLPSQETLPDAGGADLAAAKPGSEMVGKAALAQASVTIAVPVAISGQRSAGYRSAILIVKPTITNRTAPVVEDLASTMPSLPEPTKAPVKPKATGLFGSLTARLAATVVPVLVGFLTKGTELGELALAPVALLLLATQLFVSSYGAWMRRSGFAHAARSDTVSSTKMVFPFATPFLSSSVLSLAHCQGSIFDGVRNEISKMMFFVPNAFRKEEL